MHARRSVSATMPLHPEPYSPRKVWSERTVLDLLEVSPDRVADALGVSERQRELLRANAAQGCLIPAAREIALGQILGVTPDGLLSFGMLGSLRSFSEKRSVLEQHGCMQFRVKPTIAQETGRHGAFAAIFTEIPAVLFGGPRHLGSDFMLVMTLPDRDMREVRDSLRPGMGHLVEDAFASIKFSCLPGGEVRLVTCASRIHARLTSEPLQEKYKDWRPLLLQALEFCMIARGEHAVPGEHQSPSPRPFTPRFLSIPCPERTPRFEQELTKLLGSENEEELEEEIEAFKEMFTEFEEAGRVALDRRGFHQEREPKHSHTDTSDATILTQLQLSSTQRIVKAIPPLSKVNFLASDHDAIEVFEITRGHEQVELFASLDKILPPTVRENTAKYGFALEHPLPPRRLLSPAFRLTRRHFELVPAEGFELDMMLLHVGSNEQRLFNSELKSPEAEFARGILGSHFSLISKAVVTGGQQNWWRMPNDLSRTNISTTHLPDQNRHPYLRVVLSKREAGRRMIETPFVIGFKGAGYLTEGVAEIQAPTDGYTVPIQFNAATDPKVISNPKAAYPAPNPRPWGGEHFPDTIRELSYTMALRTLLAKENPELLSLVPRPLNAVRMLSLPRWKEGMTDWIPVEEYERRYLYGGALGAKNLGVYISIENCDVRVRQLYERVFVRSGKSEQNYRIAGEEVASALKSLFFWNQEETGVQVASEIAKLPSLTIPSLLRVLSHEYERQPERAERVLMKTAGRLAELVGLVHGSGGHFGGGHRWLGKNKEIGTCWGGPLGMRNIDLTGGLHDFDLPHLHFPWSTKELGNVDNRLIERSQMGQSQAFDLMYLAEAVSWLEVILRGRVEPALNDTPTKKLMAGEFNEITVLNEQAEDSPAAVLGSYWIPAILSSGMTESTVVPGGLLGDDIWGCYYQGLDRGKESLSARKKAASESSPLR